MEHSVEISSEGRLSLDGKTVCFLKTTCIHNLKNHIEDKSQGDEEVKTSLRRAAGSWLLEYSKKLLK